MIQIKIDEHKGIRPPECTECRLACPEEVLLNCPRDRKEPGKKAGDWIIVPAQVSLCTACKVCESVCPEQAFAVLG